jgi:glycosyltransferase involved in cell wall biosynthesis
MAMALRRVSDHVADIRALKVVGPFKGISGYDHHTREFVREFVRQGLDVELQNLPGWSPALAPDMRETWFDRLDRPTSSRTALHFVMPSQFAPAPGLKAVNYTMFEADRIPAAWVEAAMRADLVVLPTEFGRQVWAESGVPEQRLRVAPLGVDGATFAAPSSPLDLRIGRRPMSSFAKRFLHVGDLRPRKNHVGLLRAWMEATHHADDAVLILKLNACAPRVWAAFDADLADLERTIGRPLHQAGPVVILRGLLEPSRMPALYASATHYISMSRGEGWDLPMMEAAAAGLTLVAPRHTAYPTYLEADQALWIPAPRAPARFGGRLGLEDRIFFDGLNWWEPDAGAAREIIRAIIMDRAPATRSPQRRIIEHYTWGRAASRLIEILFE